MVNTSSEANLGLLDEAGSWGTSTTWDQKPERSAQAESTQQVFPCRGGLSLLTCYRIGFGAPAEKKSRKMGKCPPPRKGPKPSNGGLRPRGSFPESNSRKHVSKNSFSPERRSLSHRRACNCRILEPIGEFSLHTKINSGNDQLCEEAPFNCT